MVDDPIRARILLFGGAPTSGVVRDTREWDGDQWLLIATTGPAARAGHVLWFDSDVGRVTLYGGTDGAGRRLTDAWQWFGNHWEQTDVVNGQGRASPAAVFAPTLHQAILVGGVLSNGAYAGSSLLGNRVSRADFNGDGFMDFFDYGEFAAAFEAGC